MDDIDRLWPFFTLGYRNRVRGTQQRGGKNDDRCMSERKEKSHFSFASNCNSFLGELPAEGHLSYLVTCVYVYKSKTSHFHSNGAVMRSCRNAAP